VAWIAAYKMYSSVGLLNEWPGKWRSHWSLAIV